MVDNNLRQPRYPFTFYSTLTFNILFFIEGKIRKKLKEKEKKVWISDISSKIKISYSFYQLKNLSDIILSLDLSKSIDLRCL